MSLIEEKRFGKRTGKTHTEAWEDVRAVRCGSQITDDNSCTVVHKVDEEYRAHNPDTMLREERLEDVVVSFAGDGIGDELEDVKKVSFADGEFSMSFQDGDMKCIVDEYDRLRCSTDPDVIQNVVWSRPRPR